MKALLMAALMCAAPGFAFADIGGPCSKSGLDGAKNFVAKRPQIVEYGWKKKIVICTYTGKEGAEAHDFGVRVLAQCADGWDLVQGGYEPSDDFRVTATWPAAIQDEGFREGYEVKFTPVEPGLMTRNSRVTVTVLCRKP